MLRTLFATALLATLALSGCLDGLDLGDEPFDHPLTETDFAVPADLSRPVAADNITWPDLSGATLRILDHGAFAAFDTAATRFEELTGAEVEHTEEADTGSALNRAILDQGDPQFDVLYGVDNALLLKALTEDVFQRYTPQLAPLVADDLVFFGDLTAGWPATPVDHGYIALNIDHAHEALGEEGRNTTIEDLFDVRANADLFVTQDPRTSTPGLGFLLITIGVFGVDDAYDWEDYWDELLAQGVLVTHDWGTAYERHFSGGYGVFTEGHIGDRPIVTSYTESPAYEAYFGAEEVADVLLTHQNRPAAFHQVQTMGVLKNTPNQAVAEAWIEFTLTTDFQELAAPENAVYPAVAGLSTEDTYGDVDPQPGTFGTVGMDWRDIGANLDAWLAAWTALCEKHDCR